LLCEADPVFGFFVWGGVAERNANATANRRVVKQKKHPVSDGLSIKIFTRYGILTVAPY